MCCIVAPTVFVFVCCVLWSRELVAPITPPAWQHCVPSSLVSDFVTPTTCKASTGTIFLWGRRVVCGSSASTADVGGSVATV